MRSRGLWWQIGGLGLIALFAGVASAAPRGRIYGSVLDPSGAAVAGATIRAVNQGTGSESTTVSDGVGNYVFPGLPVGNYTIAAASSGFKTARQESVEL